MANAIGLWMPRLCSGWRMVMKVSTLIASMPFECGSGSTTTSLILPLHTYYLLSFFNAVTDQPGLEGAINGAGLGKPHAGGHLEPRQIKLAERLGGHIAALRAFERLLATTVALAAAGQGLHGLCF